MLGIAQAQTSGGFLDELFGGGGRPFDFSRLGTRHTSAVAYVAAVPGAVAFVASANGPIRGLARKGFGPVQCWPDCRLSMFAS